MRTDGRKGPLLPAEPQAMANAGAGFVKTILWYGDAAASPAYPTWEVADGQSRSR